MGRESLRDSVGAVAESKISRCIVTLFSPKKGRSFSANSPVWPIPPGTLSLEEVVDPLTRQDHMHHEDARGVPALLLRLAGPGRRYVTARGKVTGWSYASLCILTLPTTSRCPLNP